MIRSNLVFLAPNEASSHSACIPIDRYEPLSVIGSSEIGMVALVKCVFSKQVLAVKVLWDFSNVQFLRKVLTEVRLLRTLKHPSIMDLKACYLVAPDQIQIVTEVMDTDLSQVIKNQPRPSLSTIKVILFQLLDALEYMAQAGIAHTDVKLESTLVNAECEVKLVGLGNGKPLGAALESNCLESDEIHTPPELRSGRLGIVTDKIDTWGVGVVFLELLLWKQLSTLIRRDGNDAFLRRTLTDLISKVDDSAAQDLVARLLEQNPKQRLNALGALRHPYFASELEGQELMELTVPDAAQQISNISRCSAEEILRDLHMEAYN